MALQHRVCLPAAPLAATRAGTRYRRAIECDSAARITVGRWELAKSFDSVRRSAGDVVWMAVMAEVMVLLTLGVLKLLRANFWELLDKAMWVRLAQWMFVE